jgi:hypothetical protein
MLDLEAASVADLEVGKWEGAETTIAGEAECIFKIGASGVRGAAFIVGDGNFFPGFDITDCVNGFPLCIAVPTIVSIWETAVVDEAYGRVESANHRVGGAFVLTIPLNG